MKKTSKQVKVVYKRPQGNATSKKYKGSDLQVE